MQRPIMDPTCLAPEFADRRRGALLGKYRQWIGPAWGALRCLGRTLVTQPWRRARRPAQGQDADWIGRIARGVLYRLLFAPMLLALASVALVYAGTHPRAATADGDPTGTGLYHESVEFVAGDGTRLVGWLVPAIDAKRVLRERRKLLSARHPAIVLAHDFGQSPAQLMPLLQPLHDDGIVVLAVGLRGVGLGRPAAQTFGVQEAQDISAAVELLRKRPFVDPARVAVLGIGSGANAALLAADRDPSIAAVLLADPLVSADDAMARWVGPNRWGTRWARTLNKYTFEMVNRVDADEINLARFPGLLSTRAALTLDRATGDDGKITAAAVERVRAFCRSDVSAYKPVASAAGR